MYGAKSRDRKRAKEVNTGGNPEFWPMRLELA